MAYTSKVVESYKELDICEKFAVRDTAGATKLVDMLDNNAGRFTIHGVKNLVRCEVHNDKVKSGEPDYMNLFIMTQEGDSYYSSSETLWQDLDGMIDVLNDEEKEVDSFDIMVLTVPSKNNQQGFLKARLLDVNYVM